MQFAPRTLPMTTGRSSTLADVALGRFTEAWRDAALILAGSVLTALSARISIPLPWTPVPVTAQTLAVLLCGAAMGWRRGMLSQVLYLLEGAAGLPVFAPPSVGIITFAGPTGGYLLAFPLAAALTGWLAERGWDRRFWSMFACMLLGSAVIFAGGLLGLSRLVPAHDLLRAGLLPFVSGDLLKAALAAGVFPLLWRLSRDCRADSSL
jgi:biotin transport system substrate-specific component